MDDPREKVVPQPVFELTTSPHFPAWLAARRASLVFTTYQTAKVFFIGLQASGRLSIFERTLERVMGLSASSSTVHLSTLYQIWRFENALAPGETFNGYDAVYTPRESRVTGELDIHDVAVDAEGRVVFSNTLFNCLATTDPDHSFRVLWRPPWISKLVPEDRCHLNGLALREGRPRYVTAVSRSDVTDGWRDKRRGSGVVVDIDSSEVVCEGLSMPHSPRWYRDALWLIDSGSGFFGRVDLEKKSFEPLVFCPGFARGLAFIGNWAVIGLSDRRENRTFQDLDLEENLRARDAETRAGLLVADLRTFETPHWVRLGGVVKELYDVGVLPGIVRPMAVGFRSDEIRRYISFAPGGLDIETGSRRGEGRNETANSKGDAA
ncbi:MAG: TIGR03032 family protein [Planctomycetes bacterium]|nr:TIGR03032 family protein [Planctomycetota bacterium]